MPFLKFHIAFMPLHLLAVESFMKTPGRIVNSGIRPQFLVPPEMLLTSEPSIWKSCEDLLISQGLLNDAVVMGATATIGDLIAQFTQGISDGNAKDFTRLRFLSSMDLSRVQKYGVFGIADGVISHTWVYTLASLFQGQSYLDTLYSIFADSLFYTPLWCVWFLGAMATLEKKCLISFFANSFHTEWQSLVKISLGFYVPLNCVIYSSVPVQYRVTAFALGSLLNTALVSYWADSMNAAPTTDDVVVPSNLSTNTDVADTSTPGVEVLGNKSPLE